jgi:hypothetical protein
MKAMSQHQIFPWTSDALQRISFSDDLLQAVHTLEMKQRAEEEITILSRERNNLLNYIGNVCSQDINMLLISVSISCVA